MNIRPIKTRIFREGEDLMEFILEHAPKLPERSVLAVTSKIVALAERRTMAAGNEKFKEQLIRQESQWAMRTKYVFATIKDGMLVASAGIDESNAQGKLILLPRDSFHAAARLRRQLMRHYQIRHLGIVITDSRIAPLRSGVLGMAIGYAGFRGLRSYVGKPDIFGRKLKFTNTNVADSLATACTLVMGEGREQHPLAIAASAPIEFAQKVDRNEMKIDIQDDMYGPLFKSFPDRA